jgi:hypothetical protein
VSAAEPVAALIRHGGEHAMADVSLSDGSVIYATAGHPFWDVSAGAFVTAGELPVGDQVLTAGGARLSVTAVVLHEQDLIAYNLSIEDIHTYYAGDAGVLVHNTGAACEVPPGAPRLIYEANPKHGPVSRSGPRGENSRAPRGDCQEMLECSTLVSEKKRVGVEPDTNLEVIFRRHREFDGTEWWHGFVPNG